uniref:Reverse transcriptase n=1 Tax=Acrobeloides nanus TaxID=290746 RepID=A0A914D2H6_9BILA
MLIIPPSTSTASAELPSDSQDDLPAEPMDETEIPNDGTDWRCPMCTQICWNDAVLCDDPTCNTWHHLTCVKYLRISKKAKWYCPPCKANRICYLCQRTTKEEQLVDCTNDNCWNRFHTRCCKPDENGQCPECTRDQAVQATFPNNLMLFSPPEARKPNKRNAATTIQTLLENTEEKPKPPNGLVIMSININGLRSKKNALEVYVKIYRPDVILIQESRLDDGVPSHELQLPDYVLFRQDRKAKGGGGVAIYAHRKLKPKRQLVHPKPCHLKDSNTANALEMIAVRIQTGKKHLLAASIYRPPNSSTEDFLQHLEGQLSILDLDATPLIAGGDYNVNWLDHDESEDLRRMAEDYKLDQVVKDATHGPKLLDQVYLSHGIQPLEVRNLAQIEKLHKIPLVTVKVSFTRQKTEPIEIYDYAKAKWDQLVIKLSRENLCHTISHATTVSIAWTNWLNTVTTAIDECIPKKRVRRKNSSKWITKQLKLISRAKDLASELLQRKRTPENLAAFRRLRKNFKKEIAQAKAYYVKRRFEDANTPCKFWTCVNELTGKRNKPVIPDLETPEFTARTDLDNAELLGKTFEKSFQNHGALDRMEEHKEGNDWLPICTSTYVEEKIRSYSMRKAAGPDKLTVPMLKTLAPLLSSSIAALINRSIMEGEFPLGWKSAEIVPILKKENSTNPDDYRPIALLPIISKIAESHLFDHLYSKILPKLNQCQFGFMKHRSTTDALMYFNHIVMTGMDTAKRVAAVFFDVRKAFDSVPHGKLIERLHKHFELPPNWNLLLRSYLEFRTFKVRVGSTLSQPYKVELGVPQGSVLGPLLFVAYIDQILDTPLSDDARLVMYADDLVYVKPLQKSNLKSQNELAQDLETLNQEYCSLSLRLNSSKTKWMMLSPGKQHSDLTIKIAGEEIERVDQIRYLGIELDEYLCYKHHVARTITKC